MLISCKKTSPEYDGLIKDYGSPSLDGCSWVIEIDGVDYKPTFLQDQFKIDSLEVRLTHEDLKERTNCGLLPDAIDQIKILEISKI
jgi:hypothetical protein